ncbi:N-acetylmuramoyl-L-alanine amidase family protein [Solitalea lacus]|uniref:N-acetylmuramoyl-L-alanine amidase family protein n=1 Tax=Solitalea lacus TaxID=2911172 RepID=UPI001EDB3EB2|nr:N-acetylmuramoyl-L-alanine amidase [Solitalea lacus]UKJ05969.1 N-acetylmuramoyl-L-alanine amidase [Solitalea lacus]
MNIIFAIMEFNSTPKLKKFRAERIVFNTLALSFFFISLSSFNLQTNNESIKFKERSNYKFKTVVIDAGHGGKDIGANRGWAVEKNISLSIALKLGDQIREAFPDVKVVFTRKDDTFVELDERASIANKNKADLFISIHCNSNNSSSPYGTETYVLGLHRTKDNLEVAKRENSVILLEDNYKKKYEGFDPNSPESYIIFSLYQNKNLDKSLSIAAKIEDEFSENDNRYSRGVKQAGFVVLVRTNMPSILVETGFVSNREEGKYLASTDGQEEVASSIFRAFKSYKKELEIAN